MAEVRDRIRELIEYSGLSNKDFAEKIDINPAIVSHILSGRNNPSLHVIQQITNVYTNVNIDYLLTGRGDLFNPATTVEKQADSRQDPAAFSSNDAVRKVAPPDSTPLPAKEKTQSDAKRERPTQDSTQASENNGRKELTNVYTNVNRSEKQIERVIIFYSDKTMEEYRP